MARNMTRSYVVCPRCKTAEVEFTEVSEALEKWTQDADGNLEDSATEDGALLGDVIRVEALCLDESCGHSWTVRGIKDMTELPNWGEDEKDEQPEQDEEEFEGDEEEVAEAEEAEEEPEEEDEGEDEEVAEVGDEPEDELEEEPPVKTEKKKEKKEKKETKGKKNKKAGGKNKGKKAA